MHVCTACMVVSLLTTRLNLNTPPLAQVAPFRCKIRESNTGHNTQQARLPADSGLYNSTFPSLVNCILTILECRSDHHGSCTSTDGMVTTKSLLSLSSSRFIGHLKVLRQFSLSVSQFTNCLVLVTFALLLLCSLLLL